jgi:FkbM family methyltransferase
MSDATKFEKNPGYDYLMDKISPYISFDDIKCVFDIGSRDAIESIYFENTFKNANIYAFEPNPMQAIVCKQNVLYTKANRVSVLELALSNIEGKVDFYVTPGNIGASSMLRPQFVPWTANQTFLKINVTSTKLDSFCEREKVKPDIIWMDVQGNELNVLRGAEDSLQSVKVIYTEAGVIPYYEGHTLKTDIIKYLADFGFEVLDDKLDWTHEANVIFIKSNLLNR